ncbi:MAG: hypothetical protein IPQ07_39995 [Myxococcales bacterium]|nr:hypothetical protein [Myxococcales bacterium]
MPIANLKTAQPGDVARLLSVDPSLTWVSAALPAMDGLSGTASPWPVDFGALVNHNLSSGAYYRIAGKAAATAGDPLSFESVAPNGISGSGVTGVVGSIDEAIDSPDGVAVTVHGASSYLHVAFATPAGSPSSTDPAGEVFVVRARCDYDGAAVVTAKLYNSGALVATLGTFRPRASYGYFQVSAAGLASSGVPSANVELRLSLDSAFAILEVDLVRWVTETTASAAAIDSGWRAVPSAAVDPLLGSTPADAVGTEPQKTLLGEVSGGLSAREVAIYLRDASNADGFLQAGVLVAGPAFRTATPPALGELLGAEDLSLRMEAWGGATFGVAKRRRRVLPLRWHSLTAGEAVALHERLSWRLGTLGGVLVAMFPQSTDGFERLATAWCSVEELPAISSGGVPGKYSAEARFIERL